MSPAEIEALAPLIVFLVIAFVVSIPVVAFSLRFAAKPVVDALVRLREVQGKATASDETMLLHDRRMSLLESERQHVNGMLERLVEAERFHAQLDTPPSAAQALPAPAGRRRAAGVAKRRIEPGPAGVTKWRAGNDLSSIHRCFTSPDRSMRLPRTLCVLALGGLVRALPAAAQESTSALPTCTSQGVQRVAVMIPPGQTRPQFEETVRSGGLFPAGTQVLILEPGQLMPITNREQFDARLSTTLTLILDHGMTIEGTARMLLEVSDEGAVTAVHPNSGDPEVNRLLTRTWRLARFEPYVFDGCRVKAWVQVPQTFSSGSNGEWRQVEVRTDPPKP